MAEQSAYPLSWPSHVGRARFPRTSAFGKHSISDARDTLLRELKLLGASRVVISTNLRLRQDGLPMGAQAQPRDAGVAVYFRLKDADICLPCDAWNKVEHNLWAVAKDVEAQRGRRRWGVGSVEQAFAGYTALPAVSTSPWAVLGVPMGATAEQIRDAYRDLARRWHPDAGGSDDLMTKLNLARDAALAQAAG